MVFIALPIINFKRKRLKTHKTHQKLFLKKVKISYKTYLNDRLKQVNFHGHLTHPLYVQVTYERKTIFFKSYYFELFAKERYFLKIPGTSIAEGPSLLQVIGMETEVIKFITEKHLDDFSLEVFKKEYAYYSKDLCDELEGGFIDYLYTFFYDEGLPALAETINTGSKSTVAYDVVNDLKIALNTKIYDKLIENSFHYAPPYLPVYGFMKEIKKWPMLCLTRREWELAETKKAAKAYVKSHYPGIDADKVIEQIDLYRS
jgi:hypothetical protein